MYLKGYKYDFEPITNNLTEFEKKLLKLEQVRYIEDPERFYKETAYLKKVDGKTSYYNLFSRIKSNDFNEGSGYLTHGIDFYRGSFHGQMVRGLINYCNLGDNALILDPFCGCGTTLIEAKLLGFNSIGIDINPIACLNSHIKTTLLDIPMNILFSKNNQYFDMNYYRTQLPIRQDYNEFLKNPIKDLFYIFIYTRAISMQNRFSTSKQSNFNRTYHKIYETLSKFNILKKKLNISLGNSTIVNNDNLNELIKIKSEIIDAIITSPPYFDLIDYIEEDIPQLREILGYEQIKILKESSIGHKLETRKETDLLYWNKINAFLEESFRILKRNSLLILIIGDYRNMKNKFLEICKETGFSIKSVLERVVINIKKKTNIEYVLVLKKNIT